MRIRNSTPLMFAKTLTSRHPRTPEMVAVVVGVFDLVHEGEMTFVSGEPGVDTDPPSGERYREDDDEATGELLYPGDFAAFKPRGEVTFTGECHTPGGEPRAECPVQLRLGAVHKSLRVIGPRVWNAKLVGRKFTEPAPFSTMRIDYAHAFGGPGHASNPVGKGFGRDELPNVEWADGVRAPSDLPKPASFAPVNSRWPSRSSKVGKAYGASWRKHRAPYYAEDFDWTYFQAAPEDQQVEGPWKGTEELTLVNLHPEHPELRTRLPGVRPRVFVSDDEKARREVPMVLDSVHVDGDRAQARLVWRGLTTVREDDLSDVQFVLIDSERLGDEPRASEAYLEELAAWEADPIGLAAFEKAAEENDAEGLVAAGLEQVEASGHSIDGKVSLGGAAGAAHIEGPAGDDPVSKELHDKLGGMMKDVQKDVAKSIEQAAAAMKEPVSTEGMPLEAAGSLAEVQQKKQAIDLNEKLAAQVGQSKEAKPPAVPKGASASKPSARVPLKDSIGKLKEGIAEGQDKAKEALAEAKKKGGDVAAAEAELAKLDALAEALDDPRLAELDPSLAGGGREPPEELGPGIDASGCDFSGRDLSGVDLTEANLEKASFVGCRMVGAILSRARMAGAVLTEADLSAAKLDGVDLSEAHASDVKAEGVDLSEAKLDHALIVTCNLRGARLDGATGKQMTVRETNFAESSGEKLHFSASTFSESNLEDANWKWAHLERCRLDEVKGRRASLRGARVEWTNFFESDFSEANFERLIGDDSMWLGAKLSKANFSLSSMKGAQLSGASLDHADLFGANFRKARLDRADLSHAIAERANFFSADLCKSKLSGARFDSANLFDAKFLGAAGQGAHFDGANLNRALFSPS